MPKKTAKATIKNEPLGLSKTGFTIERVYNASITKVWNALTRNEEMKQWYFDLPEFKAEKGFEFTFQAGKDPTKLFTHVCKITDVVTNKKLAYSWQYKDYEGYSEVIFELFEEGLQTRVKLTHTGINTFPESEDIKMENFAEGWTFTIGKSLKEYVEYKKVIVFNLVTVDGFFEGPKGFGDLSWHNVDDEFNEFAINQLKTIDTLIFGRKTYEMMASYWPTSQGMKDSPIVSKLMNDIPKLVFSKTLTNLSWSNSSLAMGEIETVIKSIKGRAAKDIFILGSGNITNVLLKQGLVDEIRLIINPLLLGSGTLMFKDNKAKLRLLKAKTFNNGNILLYYKVLKNDS